VDTQKFNPGMCDQSFREGIVKSGSGKLIVGYVGRLANEKRLEDLQILDRQNDIQLVIVGDGPARNRLERILPNALFVGFQKGDELAKMYASFDLFVHTGKHETFCQSIQESLSSGTPVIAPNSGGPLDLVEHGKTGYLIDTGEPELLLKTVREFRYRHDRTAMSLSARRSVQERTWSRVNDQLLCHYKELISAAAPEVEADRLVA
jgi:phosphatidylinositol alpha 1,6-mannosyltransferase